METTGNAIARIGSGGCDGLGEHIWMKVLSVLMCVSIAWALCSVISDVREDPADEARGMVSYIVGPGDTLWSYAETITPPGGDVSQRVDELMRLNDLESSSLQVGQRVIVPKADPMQ